MDKKIDELYCFRPAGKQDSERIWEIIRQAKMQMYRENKQQWDESYPAPAHLAADVESGRGYVLSFEGKVISYGAVVFDGEPVYDSIRGKWLSDLPFVVVHRLAVADEMKRRGIASVFMQEVEKLSKAKGVHSFKVDTNFDNFYMQKILEKLGFTLCGEIYYQHGSRMAYEKLI